jgi:formylglycine-generating enzyme required for sulfatase activity
MGVSFEMVPIDSGGFTMGSDSSPTTVSGDEQPAHRVEISSFWIGKHEVTWNEYDLFAFAEPEDLDGITGPTQPYVDPTFGMGRDHQPVISITHHAALEYTRWLSKKTGKNYRLPTEAEWEYVARLARPDPTTHAWHRGLGARKPAPVGSLPHDLLGLFDLLGNVAEWVQDAYKADTYAVRASMLAAGAAAKDPVEGPTQVADAGFRYVVRGGSWQDAEAELSVTRRRASDISWSRRDPNFPKSIWWHTDAQHVGFRLARSP